MTLDDHRNVFLNAILSLSFQICYQNYQSKLFSNIFIIGIYSFYLLASQELRLSKNSKIVVYFKWNYVVCLQICCCIVFFYLQKREYFVYLRSLLFQKKKYINEEIYMLFFVSKNSKLLFLVHKFNLFIIFYSSVKYFYIVL